MMPFNRLKLTVVGSDYKDSPVPLVCEIKVLFSKIKNLDRRVNLFGIESV